MDLIKVAVRVRPMMEASADPQPKRGQLMPPSRNLVSIVDDKMLVLAPRSKTRTDYTFCYDYVFGGESSQKKLFDETARPMIESLMSGYNATIFAYGATGCGKTYTISGTSSHPGIIPQAVECLFDLIDREHHRKNTRIVLSYLEIYNEKIRDLLCPEEDNLQLRETDNGIQVADLSQFEPASVEEVINLITEGNERRRQCPTAANAESSRSHAVLQIKLLQTNTASGTELEQCVSTLSIIDLAGSERAASTQNRGKQLREGAHINKSLLALGKCINALSSRAKFIPYRESNLTRLLKFSLGGNCKTLMIACVSPNAMHYDDTLNTLSYANSAKRIKSRTTRNTQTVTSRVADYAKQLQQQSSVISELQTMVANNTASNALLEQYASRACTANTEAAQRQLMADYGRESAALDSHRRVLLMLLPPVNEYHDDFLSPSKRARSMATPRRTPARVPFTPVRNEVPSSVKRGFGSPSTTSASPTSI